MHNIPDFGEAIAIKFCRFFSDNIEDYRLRGDRSTPIQPYFEQEIKLNSDIFYHTVLYFLTGYMKF